MLYNAYHTAFKMMRRVSTLYFLHFITFIIRTPFYTAIQCDLLPPIENGFITYAPDNIPTYEWPQFPEHSLV